MPLQVRPPFHSQGRHGLTLIEMIAVLAVLAILAAALAPVLLRQMDRVAGEQESAALKSLSESIFSSAIRTHAIPSHTNWIATVATELGVGASNVAFNARSQPRYCLIDPAWRIGSTTAGEAYSQTAAGCVALTNSPRLIVLSSIGPSLTNIVSGVPSSADFNAIWEWNDATGTLPSASNLGGIVRADDLKVERVNLSKLFLRLVLTSYASTAGARYSIDSTDWATATTVPTNGFGIDAYFIQNTLLGLHNHTGTFDSQQLIIREGSFVYNQNVWRGSLLGGTMVAGLDMGTVVDKFLSAPANSNASGGATQPGVVQAMMDYMNAYEAWAAAGFPIGSLKTTAKNAQSTMMNLVSGLYNNPPETNCP